MRTLTKKSVLKKALCLGLIFTMLLAATVSFVSADAYNPNTDFMSGKYGIFQHYRYGYNGLGGSLSNWNANINSFNAANWANTIAAEGATWVTFTIGQGRGYYCAPNAKWDELCRNWGIPVRSPSRDLVMDLYNVLNPKGIKLFLYFVCDASGDSKIDADGRRALNQSATLTTVSDGEWALTPAGVDNQIAMAREWALRYGTRVSGWFIDGFGHAYNGWSDAKKAEYIAALKEGNPNAVVTLNGANYSPQSPKQDYISGEFGNLRLPTSRWGEGGMQWHACDYIGGGWGGGGLHWSDQNIPINYTRNALSVGGAITWDLYLDAAGNHDTAQRNQMTAMKAAVGGGTPPPAGNATFYQDINYGGTAKALNAGNYTLAQLNAAGIPNDWTSSVKVQSGYTMEIYDNDNFGGTKWTFTSDNPDFVSAGCNDRMSSVKIYQTGSGGGNLCLNRPYALSSEISASENGAKAIDGNASTKWCSLPESTNPGADWIRVDLGSVQTIRNWKVSHAGAGGETAAYNTRDFKLQRSDNDAQWYDVDTVTGNTANTTDRNVNFTARYVRLYITNAVQPGVASDRNNARIYEFGVY